MFSSTLKRSVATLAIVAGLLAAAVPASAMPAGVNAHYANDALVKAPTKAKPAAKSAKPTAKSAKPVLGAWRPDSDHGPMW